VGPHCPSQLTAIWAGRSARMSAAGATPDTTSTSRYPAPSAPASLSSDLRPCQPGAAVAAQRGTLVRDARMHPLL
jgi:hypothetical protein